jgi:DNA-binding winged helix-turn-helix (wHTH) protein/TolB-like protein/Flp pilus assembly protein TadD
VSRRKPLDIGAVRADPDNDCLEGASGRVALEPRVMDVLVELHRHRGEVVARETLIERVWDNYPGADQSLTTSVSKLRRALREVGGDAAVVRTVPKRGYRLERSRPAAGPRRPVARRSVVAFVLALIAVATMTFIGFGARSSPPRVAVLPLAAVGGLPERDLVRGVGQEISTRLASLDGLELVYGGQAALAADGGSALGEIAERLDADYLFTGSFRREAVDDAARPRYRIAAQLIRASDRTSVWGDVFTAPAGELFALESDIAAAVAVAVPGVGEPVADRSGATPTDDERAYRHFLRAIGLSRGFLPPSEQVADAYYALRRAVELDPNFARAWAELSVVLGLQEIWDLTEVDLTAAEALERARTLAPRDPDVLIAAGLYHVRHGETAESARQAIRALMDALEQRPNSARALAGLSRALRQGGAFRLAVDVAEAALRRAPANAGVIGAAAAAHSSVRHWRRVEALRTRLSELEPERFIHWRGRARMRFQATGSIAEARAVLAQAPDGLVPPNVPAGYDLYARDFDALLARVEPLIERAGLEAAVIERPGFLILAGFVYREVGNDTRADRIADAALRVGRVRLEDHPDHPIVLDLLARALLLDGQDKAAVAAICRAAALQTGHVSNRLGRLEGPARIAALVGREDAALRLIERLIAADYGVTPLSRHALEFQPSWDPLRDRERFQQLLDRAPVARRWDGKAVRTERLLARARNVLDAPPPEIPSLDPLCADVPAGRDGGQAGPSASG